MEEMINQENGILNEKLDEIKLTSESILQRYERSYATVKQSLQNVKDFISNYAFKNEDEEIRFFKILKPRLLKQLIYYWKLFHLEAEKPVHEKEELSDWYKKQIERINQLFQRNNNFYIYYRLCRTEKDVQYFTRASDGYDILPEYSLEMDRKFCTIHSLKLAKLQAYEMLNDHLLTELYTLKNSATSFKENNIPDKPDTTWTDSKVDLIELGYAIQSRGSVNHGKADVKLVMQALEFAFNISTGNYYAVFQQNIRIRKKNRTVYLDKLRDYLEKRMDDTDEQ